MARILITGATGFIGSWLIVSLGKAGHELDLLLRDVQKLPQVRQQCRQRGGDATKLHALSGDLALPGLGLALQQQATQKQWDMIIHTGAMFGWNLDYALAHACNVQGSLSVVQLAAQQNAHLIWLGGFMLLNQTHMTELKLENCLEENSLAENNFASLYRKVGVYEASKIEAHFRSRQLAEKLGLSFNVVHPATVCGHSETGEIDARQTLAELACNLYRGYLSAIPGSKQHQLPMISVDNLVDLLTSLVAQPLPSGEELLAAHPDSLALVNAVQVLGEVLQVPAPQRFVPITLLNLLLRLPGLEKRLHTQRESLAFIRKEKPDYSGLKAFIDERQLALADMNTSLHNMARYIKEEQLISMPSAQSGGKAA